MWYNYLDRSKHYLRSYRTHNLWLNQYQIKMRTPRTQGFHITAFKRLAKTYSGVSIQALLCVGKFEHSRTHCNQLKRVCSGASVANQ